MDFVKRVSAYIREKELLQKGDGIVVGISGGADSVAMLLTLLQLRESEQIILYGIHVNHGIRGQEALEDQQFVEQLCEAYQVPLLVKQCKVPQMAQEQGKSLEEMARELRYQAFYEYQKETGADRIAIAHHKNDQAETVLHHLCRGTGVKGLGGMDAKRGSIIRPFLCVTRQEILDFLEERKQSYQTDSTNQDCAYTRNYLRNRVVPDLETGVNAKTVSHISDVAERMKEVADFIETESEKQWDAVVSRISDTEYVLREQPFLALHPVLQQWITKKILEILSQQHKDVEQRHIISIIALFQKQVGRQVDLPYHMVAGRSFAGVNLFLKEQKDEVSQDVPKPVVLFQKQTGVQETALKEVRMHVLSRSAYDQRSRLLQEKNKRKNCTKWFDYDKIKDTVIFRLMQKEDRLQIDREGHHKSAVKLCMEAKKTARERARLRVIADAEQVIWIPGVRANMYYHITEDTKQVLEIEVIKDEGEEKERYGMDWDQK